MLFKWLAQVLRRKLCVITNQPPQPVILYVENSPDDVFLLQRALRKLAPSFALRFAETVAAAISYLVGQEPFSDRQRFPFPAVVLLDYSLDCEKGTDLLTWVRKSGSFQHLPVVMYTGGELLEIIRDCYEAGANHFVNKAADLGHHPQFIRCLEKCLGTSPMCLEPLRGLPEYQARPQAMI